MGIRYLEEKSTKTGGHIKKSGRIRYLEGEPTEGKPLTGTSGSFAPKLSAAEEEYIRPLLTPEQRKKYQETGVIPEEIEKTLKSTRGFGSGLLETATLGIQKLIPGVKEKVAEAKEEAPKAFGAGEMAGYLLPTGAPSQIYKETGKLAGKVLPKAPGVVQKIAGAGVGGGITEGVMGTIKEGDVKEGAVRGLLGSLYGAGMTGLQAGAGKLLQMGGQKILKQALPLRKYVPKGFKLEQIDELGVSAQTLSGTSKKVAREMGKMGNQIDDIITQQQPDVRFNPERTFIKLKENIHNIKEAEGVEKEVLAAAKKLYANTFKPKGLTGKDLTAAEFRKMKGIMGNIAFPKDIALKMQDPAKVKAAKILYFDMMDDMAQQIPEITEPNKAMHQLKVIDDLVDEAMKKKEFEKFSIHQIIPLLRIASIGGGAFAIGEGQEKVGAGMIAAGALATPRGAHSLKWAGRQVTKEPLTRAAVGGLSKLRFSKEEEDALGKKRFGGRRR